MGKPCLQAEVMRGSLLMGLKPTPIALTALFVYHFENVFDWRTGPRRGLTAAPIPT